MKKLIISLLILTSSLLYPCADIGDEDYYYYNLFMQETMNSPQYFPFLLSSSTRYYESNNSTSKLKNENIEDWQRYFNIKYEEAEYLVFKASRSEIDNLIKGNRNSANTLSFADTNFVKKYIQALKYLSYAKYLEPYMVVKAVVQNNWYYENPDKRATDLDYQKVINVLTKSWNAETDRDLKLRYGYQLVRFAHYNTYYAEAIEFFNKYVKSLNYTPIMYYYALDQKAGAERGLENFVQANYDFFTVFTNTTSIKNKVYSSLLLSQSKKYEYDVNYNISNNFLENLLQKAKTINEKNDAYMLLGYQGFNNPVNSIEKILNIDPNAIQAKVLIARAVNQIERNNLIRYYYCDEARDKHSDTKTCPHTKDNKLPFVNIDENYFKQILAITSKQSQNKEVNDKTYWNLTEAYLYFLKKEYKKSRKILALVTDKTEVYQQQKDKLNILLDICEQPVIDAEFEKILFAKYKTVFDNKKENSTNEFIIDILANRYFIQKEYAKSFLLHNDLMYFTYNPNLELLADIEKLYYKKDKTPMDKFLASNLTLKYWVYENNNYIQKDINNFVFPEYVAYIKGSVYLVKGDLNKALEQFKQVKDNFALFTDEFNYDTNKTESIKSGVYNGYSNLSNKVFGYNKIEFFGGSESKIMGVDYLDEFKFIKSTMNKRELTEILIQLDKTTKNKNELGAKAAYLLGNFYYNISSTGYYRHLFRFDKNNANGSKFRGNNIKRDIFNNIYFKPFWYDGTVYFPDYISVPTNYLESALTKANNEELKARIIFALSKTEQEDFYIKNSFLDYGWQYNRDLPENDGVLIKNRKYFEQLKQLNHTKFYNEVKSNCLYFNYYVLNY